MGTFAAIVGAVGGLSVIMGIVVALDIVTPVINNATLGWAFWFGLAAVLLLGSLVLKPNQNED
jgi:uncharacterized protein (DUF58 family)